MPAFLIEKARPSEAVPRGRMGYDLSTDRLLLHTIQTEEAFDELLSTGVLVPDPARVDPFLADGYEWLYRQMTARLATEGDGAVWFWAQIRRQDLVELCKQSPGEVLLTCRVPRERVLLSQFGDWHSALNRSPLLIELPGESDEEYCARLERAFEAVDARISAATLGATLVGSTWGGLGAPRRPRPGLRPGGLRGTGEDTRLPPLVHGS